MKAIKTYILASAAALALSSCDDFLNTLPKDAMSPPTTWKTSDDAEKFLVGCYDGWEGGAALLYWDAGSDFGYNNFPGKALPTSVTVRCRRLLRGGRSTTTPLLADATPFSRM